jgi:hypothetical protein
VLDRFVHDAEAVNDVVEELKRLSALTVGELVAQHAELFGEPSRSRNKKHLVKKLAWRIQATAGGGLSARAVQRIADLGDGLPDRWQERATRARKAERRRDPRLPPAGTVLRRTFDSVEHEVRVLEDSFEYCGERFGSLSAVATRIAESRWNGFTFFGLNGEGS